MYEKEEGIVNTFWVVVLNEDTRKSRNGPEVTYTVQNFLLVFSRQSRRSLSVKKKENTDREKVLLNRTSRRGRPFSVQQDFVPRCQNGREMDSV